MLIQVKTNLKDLLAKKVCNQGEVLDYDKRKIAAMMISILLLESQNSCRCFFFIYISFVRVKTNKIFNLKTMFKCEFAQNCVFSANKNFNSSDTEGSVLGSVWKLC